MNTLLRLLGEILNVSESRISINTVCDDIDTWDSLTIINMAIALESDYGIALTAEEVGRLTCIKSIVQILKDHKVFFAD